MAGRSEDVYVAAADIEGEEHLDPFEGDRAVDVDSADRGCSDAVAELEQCSLDSLVAPRFVLAGHLFNESGNRRVDRWPAGAVGVGPFPGDQVVVRAQDRVGGD